MRKGYRSKKAFGKKSKAEAKRQEAEAKRVARAKAKADKEAKAQALVTETNKEVDGLVTQLKSLVDKTEASMISSMREAAEMTFRLQDKYKLKQSQISDKIGRSQAWVSTILKWRAAGYPQTAFGPQSKARDARRLSGPDNSELPAPPKAPDPQVGMPPGPTLNSVVKVTGNDVDTEASAEARKAAAPEPCAFFNRIGHNQTLRDDRGCGFTTAIFGSTDRIARMSPAPSLRDAV